VKDFTSQLSNPYSTGGGGPHFEAHVQASFVSLMLAGGFAPCLSPLPIVKVKLQGKYAGYDTDDLIVFAESGDGRQKQRIVGQIKHSIAITTGSTIFRDVINAAWNDFNDPRVFTKGKDALVLITGPLSATDIDEVRPLLDWARHSENATEYVEKVELPGFSSDPKRDKLAVFRAHLKTANAGKGVSDEDLFSFLRHFHLLSYDLDIKSGVILSLLHSLIGQYSPDNAVNLWARIVDEVQSNNKYAGTITIASLPEDLRSAFKGKVEKEPPSAPAAAASGAAPRNWNLHADAADLAVACLIGSWDENSTADVAVVETLAQKEYSKWIARMQEILQQPDTPLVLNNGVWTIPDRKSLWQALGTRIFDSHLDGFKNSAVKILGERDPRFELSPEERYSASLSGKVLSHSEQLRAGIAETVALMGASPSALIRCSLSRSENTAASIIHDLFDNADHVTWGGLNSLLPVLAEAAPNEFLSAVETSLQKTPSPYDVLFRQEGTGVTGTNYLTGLLWALENLAWDENSLVRVTVLLGKLAEHDPGGNWGNRPSNSLSAIFLPWYPQTKASVEKRKVAVQTLVRETPGVAWKLLIGLLPNSRQMTTGAHKPAWRNPIPAEWKPVVSNKEFGEQVLYYSGLAVDVAEKEPVKLAELTHHLASLPKPSFDKLLSVLSASELVAKTEEERLPMWESLTDFVFKHRRFADAQWALGPEVLSQIENVSKALAPTNPVYLHRRLFDNHASDLYEERGNWQAQDKRLEQRRQNAIQDILKVGGLAAVFELAKRVRYSFNVGSSLGTIAEPVVDSEILPGLLTTDNPALKQLVSGFVWARHRAQGWNWTDNTGAKDWTPAQKSQFLAYLPFIDETWKRVAEWLGGHEKDYWGNVPVNPYQSDGDLVYAIDKLLENGRPKAAVGCLSRLLNDKKPLDCARALKALREAASAGEASYALDEYDAAELIKYLQSVPDCDRDALALVEWTYLPLLEREHAGATPVLLEQKLASDPKFFCEILRIGYRSDKQPKPETPASEQQQMMAGNAYRLLSEWQTVPGTQADKTFVDNQFKQWIEAVRKEATESGHLDVALMHIGGVLVYSPRSADGLWNNATVLEELNKDGNTRMRNGFRQELFNSRGAHWVDSSGKPELDLAAKYKQQAEAIENAGYQRVSATLRGLSQSYEQEAKWVVSEHGS
jgi:hypothetical protein